MLEPRSQAHGRTQMTEYVLPPHANAMGNIFGGQVMAWVDLCAAICAQRHSGRMAVTAFVDDLKFQQPVRVGDVLVLEAVVTAVFRTSMEIGVTVQGEDAKSGRRWPCVDARLTFVAIDDAGTPTDVPALLCDTPALRASQEAGQARRAARLAR